MIRLGLAQLQQQLQVNYEVARSFYQQRRALMLQTFDEKLGQVNSVFETSLQEYANKFIKQVSNKVYDAVKKGDVSSLSEGAEGEFAIILDELQQRFLEFPKLLDNRQWVASELGKKFEAYLAKFRVPTNGLNQRLDKMINAKVEQLGDTVSTGALVSGKKAVRPDIGIFPTGVNWDKKSATVSNGKYTEIIELQTVVSVETVGLQNQFSYDKDFKESVLAHWMELGAFGLSVKIWDIGHSNRKLFTQSSVLQDSINADFNSSYPRTWGSNYARAYADYIVSKNLFNIIGPMNVYLVAGKDVYGFDDFLKSNLLYMNIDYVGAPAYGTKDSARESGYEAHPIVTSSNIAIQNLQNVEHKIQYYSTRRKQKDGSYKVFVNVRSSFK